MKVQFNIKVDERDLKFLHKIAEIRGEDASDLARLAIRKEIARFGFLKENDKKVLGVF